MPCIEGAEQRRGWCWREHTDVIKRRAIIEAFSPHPKSKVSSCDSAKVMETCSPRAYTLRILRWTGIRMKIPAAKSIRCRHWESHSVSRSLEDSALGWLACISCQLRGNHVVWQCRLAKLSKKAFRENHQQLACKHQSREQKLLQSSFAGLQSLHSFRSCCLRTHRTSSWFPTDLSLRPSWSAPSRSLQDYEVRRRCGPCVQFALEVVLRVPAFRAQTAARSARGWTSAVQCLLRLTRMNSRAKSRIELGVLTCLSSSPSMRH